MVDTLEISKSARRIDIMQQSVQLFLDHGFAGTSMSAIAKACGITKASLYHHFTGKEELFVSCVTHGYSAALTTLREIAEDPKPSPQEKLTQALNVIYDTTIDSDVGRLSPLIAEVSRSVPSVARAFHEDYITPQQETLWGIVGDGVAKGAFKPMDLRQFSHIVFGPMVTLSLSREMFASFDDLDTHFPVQSLKDGHIQIIQDLLKPEASGENTG